MESRRVFIIGFLLLSLALMVHGPEGQRKLAGGASHRIITDMETAPEGAAEMARFPAPLRGAFAFATDPVVGTTG